MNNQHSNSAIERYLESVSDAQLRTLAATVELRPEPAKVDEMVKPADLTLEQVNARLTILAERQTRIEKAHDAIIDVFNEAVAAWNDAKDIDARNAIIINSHTARIGELSTCLDALMKDLPRCLTAGCSLPFSHRGPCVNSMD